MIRPRAVVCPPVMLAFALVLLSAAAARAQSGYGFFPLDPQGFETGSITLDINESGTVLMRRVDGTYIWTQANGVTPLIADPDVNGRFRAISFNNANKVLGVACRFGCPATPEEPATWSESEGLVFLSLATATAMNNGGTIVGTVVSPVILRPGQFPQPIPGVATAVAVNDAEQVAGMLPSGFPYVWTQAGGIVTIPKLPGRTDEDWTYRVFALNNAGQVVGTFQHRQDLSEPEDSADGGVFLWSPSTGTIDLQFPQGEFEPFFSVVTLNDRGHVAVTYDLDSPPYSVAELYRNGRWTFVFPAGTSMHPFRVDAINNDGWMTGSGEYHNPPFPILGECVQFLFQCAGWALTAPSVDLTVNGADGPLTLGPGDPLNLAFAFDAPGGAVNPTEVYAGFITTSGIVWFHPTNGVSLTPTRLYQGPLSPFGPAPLLSIPDASAVPPGPWVWFVIIDYDSDGVVNGDYVDFAVTTVTGGSGG
jgi:hypothetical protein